MNLLFTVKTLGKKRPYLRDIEIALNISSSCRVADFLTSLVNQQVDAYNQRQSDKTLISFIGEEKIKEQLSTNGNIKFNERYNQIFAEKDKAIETVLLAFEDGLIALFIEDKQYEDLKQQLELKEGDSISILRLTFLAGSIW
jgi:hypothetical protein